MSPLACCSVTVYVSGVVLFQVLHLEQLLTTGGGWQDQCGGLYGGAKKSSSDTGLPVKISTQQIGMYREYELQISGRDPGFFPTILRYSS